MKIGPITVTEKEGEKILNTLSERYGDYGPRTLLKYAVRELVEVHEMDKQRFNKIENG